MLASSEGGKARPRITDIFHTEIDELIAKDIVASPMQAILGNPLSLARRGPNPTN